MIQQHQIFQVLNFLSEPRLQEEILEHSQILKSQKGEYILREGEYIKVLPIVLEGTIRIFQTREDREILLYYVEPSQTCMMSMSASFFNHSSTIQAIAVEPTTILTIPVKFISEWQTKYISWNKFVIKTFRKRYDDLLDAYESVAFDQIDKRVLDYLHASKERKATNRIPISHLQLANELGTTRVVISRILKQYELDQKLKLHRGVIELL